MGDEKFWYIAIDGKQSGPFPQEEIIHRIKNGSLDDRYYAFKKGMNEWQSIQQIQEFADYLFFPPPPPPSHKKQINRPKVETKEQIYNQSKTEKKKRKFFVRLFFSLLFAVIGFFIGVFTKDSNILPTEVVRYYGSQEIGLAGAFAGFILGLLLFKPSKILSRISIFIGFIATILTIYFTITDFRQGHGPSYIDISGEWTYGNLRYTFNHTGGQTYIWTLWGTPESGKAWINSDKTITAIIRGNQHLFKVSKIQGNCPQQIKDIQGAIILTRRSPCR